MNINPTKLVAGAILNLDGAVIVVAGTRYFIKPPTIHKIAGAAYHLADLKIESSLNSALKAINNSYQLAKALSWFIEGNTSLAGKLSKGTIDEVVNGIETAYSLISADPFIRLSALVRSVERLTAKQP